MTVRTYYDATLNLQMKEESQVLPDGVTKTVTKYYWCSCGGGHWKIHSTETLPI